MDLISQIPLIGGTLGVLIPFVIVLGIVVSIHEYGHYIVGRWCGIHAEVFSLGFGKTLWSRVDKRGTKWQIALLPLGGYVKFLGDADASSKADTAGLARMDAATKARSFPGASVGRRFLTVLAGPVANFILATIVFAGLLMWQGQAVRPVIGEVAQVPGMELPFQSGDVITSINGTAIGSFIDIHDVTETADRAKPMTIELRRGDQELTVQSPFLRLPIVGGMIPLSPAARAGLLRGDYIVSTNDVPMHSFFDLMNVMKDYKSGPVHLKVWRNGEMLELELTPEKSVVPRADGFEEKVMIGVLAGFAFQPQTEFIAPWTALYYGGQEVVGVITGSLSMLQHIATGKIGASGLAGPIGIAQVSSEMATNGLVDFIGLIAMVSAAIGMMNLFPIPVLDGGHLVVFTYEAVRGRPPSVRALEIGMSIGLAMVLLLMLFTTYNDIMRL